MTLRQSFGFPRFLICFLAMAAVSVSSAKAIPTKSSTEENSQTQDQLEQLTNQELVDRYRKSKQSKPKDFCGTALILSEMVRRGGFAGNVKKTQHGFNLDCALGIRNWTDAYKHLLLLENVSGEYKPRGAWGYRIALVAEMDSDAIDRLITIANTPEPKQLLRLDVDEIFRLSRMLYRNDKPDEAEKLFTSLYNSRHFLKLEPNVQSSSASAALKHELRDGQVADISKMLEYITGPHKYGEMLADRQYENAWPAIEERAGVNMGNILTEYITIQKLKYESDKTDKEAKQRLAHALHYSGKFEEVIKLTQSIDRSAKGSLSWEEDDGWALNLRAYSLDALGKLEEASRLFDQFAAIPYDPSKNGWLVSFVINRASRLVGQKHFVDGLAAANHAEKIVKKSGSPFAKMLVWHAKACALHNLGRADEAAVNLRKIEEHHEDSLQIAAETYLCFGNRDRAAELVVTALLDETKRNELIEALQKPDFELFYTGSALPNIHDELRNHPKVERAFNKIARDIPDSFIPLGGVRRNALKVQRLKN